MAAVAKTTGTGAAQKNKSAAKWMLEPLTSFRFVAALMVFAQHAVVFGGALKAYQLGFAGVSFFFVLSGFILTYVYLEKFRAGGAQRRHTIKKFYAARIAKLYPVQFLMFLAAIPFGIYSFLQVFPAHTVPKLIGTFFLQLTMTQSYFPNYDVAGTFDGPAWSISTEFFFYLIFPALIFLLIKYRKKLSVKKLLLGWIVLWAGILALLAAPFVTVNITNWELNQWLLYMFPIRRLLDFVLGMVLGLGFLHLQRSGTHFIHKFRKWHWTALECGALAMVAAAIWWAPNLEQTMRYGAFLLPFWGILIFVFAWQNGLVSKIVSAKPLLFLGNISFSFYMTHWLVLQYAGWFGWDSGAFYVPAALAISLAFASAMYFFYEEPSRKRLKAYLENANFSRLVNAYRQMVKKFHARPQQAHYSYSEND